jgi:hypothetical protein
MESKKKMVVGYKDYISNRLAKEQRSHRKKLSVSSFSNLNLDLTLEDDSSRPERRHMNVEHKPEKYIQSNPQKKHEFSKPKIIQEVKQLNPKPDYIPSPMYKQMNDKIENPLHRDPGSRFTHLLGLLKAVYKPASQEAGPLFQQKHKVESRRSEMKDILNNSMQVQPTKNILQRTDRTQFVERQLNYSI